MKKRYRLTSWQPTELSEQQTVFAWAQLHENRCARLKLLFAIPNGMRTTIGTAVKMKQAGMKSGVPDIFLPMPRWGYCGLWIELKRSDGGVVSTSQQWWHDELRRAGYQVEVCAGAQEAIAAICDYLQYKEG